MKKIAVILSGCGVSDGSEIHEATLALLAIRKAGCEYSVFAPDKEQADVVNHYSGAVVDEKRNVLAESARIARGKISPLSELNPEKFDAIVFPGGFGVAKNLSDYAYKGENYSVIPELEKILLRANKLKKPVGAMCISPILLAKVFRGCRITLGDVCGASEAAVKNGAEHVVTTHGETVVDEKYRIVSTPAYMLDANIVQIAESADNLVRELLKLV
ncbi:MAG: isoprenoid biosynthesis glyoxalase ElbB [Prevotellaceae bacterium]|jgi:enhancing lycopene biosynthesis protein 2|nr:isoprenoid biosynthesis glyoxalase ElbB [Prevotellaceae bacterium]